MLGRERERHIVHLRRSINKLFSLLCSHCFSNTEISVYINYSLLDTELEKRTDEPI